MTDEDRLHAAACARARCRRCAFVRQNGWIRNDQVKLQLISHELPCGKWYLSCGLCHGEDPKSIGTCLQHVLRHARGKLHNRLARRPGEARCVSMAPPVSAFQEVLNETRNGKACSQGLPGVGKRFKVSKLRYCLAEARWAQDRKFLRRAVSIALVRDMRKSRLMVRFVAVDGDLCVRRGLLGMRRNFGHTAKAITKATGHIMRRAATVCASSRCCVVDQRLLRHIRKSVTMICTDSAADEILASEMMRAPVLQSMSVLTPNLRVVLRDKAHSSRRRAARQPRTLARARPRL